jgi:putative endonuclease
MVRSSRSKLGSRGEDLAAALLQARGLTVIARNYRCRFGEIDVVCAQGAVTVFCEVKLRRSVLFGVPEEAITPRKLQRLILSAQTYLEEQGRADSDWRIDLVAIELDHRGAVMRQDVIEGIGS